MKRIRVYFDLDGVLARYPLGGNPNFKELEPIAEMINLFNLLASDNRYEVYLASTAPWSNPAAWEAKRLWVEANLGEGAYKALILTHHKELLIGEYLIDDRSANGAAEFSGEWIKYEEGITSPYEILNIIGY